MPVYMLNMLTAVRSPNCILRTLTLLHYYYKYYIYSLAPGLTP
jgi:hypothetical protein